VKAVSKSFAAENVNVAPAVASNDAIAFIELRIQFRGLDGWNSAEDPDS
jgi:hypothetical protein